MRINRGVVGLVAVAGVAYAVGHVGPDGGRSDAWAQAEQDVPHDMAAYLKVATPGEHHERLEALVGEWDGVFKIWMEPGAEAMESEGTVSREWILDGRFIREIVEAHSVFGTFQGMGFIGYNNFDGQYQTVRMDSMSTAIYTESGTYDPDTKVLHTAGQHRDPVTGRVVRSRGTLDLSDPDRHVYLGYSTGADGRSFKAFEGTTTRKK